VDDETNVDPDVMVKNLEFAVIEVSYADNALDKVEDETNVEMAVFVA
jgi:hypothetical protein